MAKKHNAKTAAIREAATEWLLDSELFNVTESTLGEIFIAGAEHLLAVAERESEDAEWISDGALSADEGKAALNANAALLKILSKHCGKS